MRKARRAFGVTYTETRKAIYIEYTEKKRGLIRDLGFSIKSKKQKRDGALQENTKLMNCVADESRKLKSIQMKLKRLQAKLGFK